MTATMMYWGAEADCRLRTAYQGRLAEIRDIPTRDFIVYQLASESLFIILFILSS